MYLKEWNSYFQFLTRVIVITGLLNACSSSANNSEKIAEQKQENITPDASHLIPADSNFTTDKTVKKEPVGVSFFYSDTLRLSSGSDEIIVTFSGVKSGDLFNVRLIQFIDAASRKLLQEIKNVFTETPDLSDSSALSFTDLNHDGYADIMLLEFIPVGPNVPYLIWLFDPDLEEYYVPLSLPLITSPTIDSVGNFLVTYEREGYGEYETCFYIFEKKDFKKVRIIHESLIEESHEIETVESELIDGEMVEIMRRKDPTELY